MASPLVAAIRERFAAPKTPEYRWACDLDDCDGRPHDGADYKHARTKQRMPAGDWFVWLLLCGRGFGKTRTGSEVFLEMVLDHPVDLDGIPTEWLIAGPTYDDTVKLLFQGVSSLKHALRRRGFVDKKDRKAMAAGPERWYDWNKNEKMITLSTGQRIMMQYAEGNDDLGRGGNWAGVWLDELGTYKNKIRAAWDESVLFSIRAMLPGGWQPRIMITTTPKTSAKEAHDLLWEIVQTADTEDDFIVTKGTTWENQENIPEKQLTLWKRMFPEGTRSRRQELNAELMRDVDGALWTAELLDRNRVKYQTDETLDGVIRRLQLARTVVSIDPAGTKSRTSDETAIIGFGQSLDAKGYVLADRSGKYSPGGWARAALQLCIDIEAGAVIIETSGAGSDSLKFVLERTALEMQAEGLFAIPPAVYEVKATGSTGGKNQRAMPVANYFHTDEIALVGGFPLLEDQLTTWTPLAGWSPDRLDAMVWAAWALMQPQTDNGVTFS